MELFDNSGLFNLNEFIGFPLSVARKYFEDKGWVMVESYNSNTYLFNNYNLNKSITIKILFSLDLPFILEHGVERVKSIECIDGVQFVVSEV